jgi:hypothetical protein
LDYFNKYHLLKTIHWLETTFFKIVLKDIGDFPFSLLGLAQEGDENSVIQLQDVLEDLRFTSDKFEKRDILNHVLIKGCPNPQIFMTPHFLQHFDLKEETESKVLLSKAVLLSFQLGFMLYQ